MMNMNTIYNLSLPKCSPLLYEIFLSHREPQVFQLDPEDIPEIGRYWHRPIERIEIARISSFTSPAVFFYVLIHEFMHWTGDVGRLLRPTLISNSPKDRLLEEFIVVNATLIFIWRNPKLGLEEILSYFHPITTTASELHPIKEAVVFLEKYLGLEP